MPISHVTAIYFSPTGNAKKIARCIAATAASILDVPCSDADFTLPAARETHHIFSKDDLVAFCTPVYAGRIPNKLLPYVESGFEGNGAKAIIACSYGNRSFQDALMELCLTLTANGFDVIAAAAMPSEHAFAPELATGRPNETDLEELEEFTKKALDKLNGHGETYNTESTPGQKTDAADQLGIPGNNPVGPYYTPLGLDGKPAQFLKAKPKTNMERCDNCGICASLCPMGSISFENFADVPGTCIKCQACIRFCPRGAKYLDDEAFLSHKAMLMENYTAWKENAFYL